VALPLSFLDELRARTSLSGLIGKTLKLDKAGREFKACCPIHNEQTPSFTVNDDKGFYHCFGCGAHGDALRWLTDVQAMAFMDAVKLLAADAGMEVPARSAEAAARDAGIDDVSATIAAAADWYARQLLKDAKVLAVLAGRGVSEAAIARFGLGYAPAKPSVTTCGAGTAALAAAGLMFETNDGLWRDRFHRRIMVPIHDARGRNVGFAGRGLEGVEPKYLNNPDAPHFDKGRLLFNLHRAAPAARAAGRLLIVEGQFDTIALDSAGIAEVVAPGGTALTIEQVERAWRVVDVPVLLFDGDAAGLKAAYRACERALPLVGPGGRSLAVALLPEGEDPDSLVRGPDGVAAIEAAIAGAASLAGHVWDVLSAAADGESPEGRSALWARLERLAGGVQDGETRTQYLADWRSRFDARFPPLPLGLPDDATLPGGSHATISALGAEVQARLRRVADAWLLGSIDRAATGAKAANRWAYELGARELAGLIDTADAEPAMGQVIGALIEVDPQAKAEQVERARAYGKKRGGALEPMLLDMKCAGYQRTDMGNAERWRARFGEDYLYTTAKGWLGWDGRRYRVLNQEKDTTPAEVLGSVFETVRAIQREAGFVRDTGWPEGEDINAQQLLALGDDPRALGGMDRLILSGKKAERLSGKLGAWGRASESSGRLGCIAGLAKRWVTVELTDFDTGAMLLNCHNGTLRFVRADDDGPARVELQPHNRADRLTKLAAVAYDPDAKAPIYQKLIRWAQPDAARRRYLRQWAGYNLTGDMGEQIFHIWYGPLAANGKSTVGNAWRDALGDYGDTTNVETFLSEGVAKRGDQATPDIVRLPGVRMLTAGEPPKGAKINEPLINSVTGGDPMLARDNFRSFFRFLPIFKFTLWCNDLPAIPQGTAGIWRRVKVVPWEQHLEADERDRDLPKKLVPEFPGIFAWMVRGLIDWMEHGFVEPETVSAASADYKEDSDPLSSFLRLCTEHDAEARVGSTELHELFCAWARAAGETEWKHKGFSQAMKAKGFTKKASNGIWWLGLRMVRQTYDFVDGDGRPRSAGSLAAPDGARPPPFDDDMPP